MPNEDNDAPQAIEPTPTYAKIGVTPSDVCARLRIIDAATGEPIEKVIEADAENGRIVRFAVEDGGLVRENNRFKTVEEDREIIIEWTSGDQKDSF